MIANIEATKGFKRVSQSWPMCPDCGERTPSLTDCPFCADIAAIRAEPDYEPMPTQHTVPDATGR